MKKGLLLGLLGLLFSVAAMAADGYAVRYSVKYSTWDRGFYDYYSYSERTTYTSCNYYTCYDGFDSGSNVYVEETVVEHGQYSGYTRVTVYDSARYHSSGRYVTYYTHNGRVVRRHYHRSHRHVRTTYVHRSYTTVNYVYLDDFTASIILGTHFVSLGADVLSRCDADDDLCIALGLASSISGSAISISASIREHRRSELQRYMEEQRRDKEDEDLLDSLDENFEELN